jgi:hypothetical protein
MSMTAWVRVSRLGEPHQPILRVTGSPSAARVVTE